MSSTPHSDVLIIGASRGIGLAIATKYLELGATVVATVRGTKRTGLNGLLETYRDRLTIESVDITAPSEVVGLHERLANRRFDLLFANAGVTNGPDETPSDVSTDEFTRLMVTNALSPVRVIEELKALVNAVGTIAIMSSGQGSIANNTRGGFEIYRSSKSALNQLVRSYAVRNSDDHRTLLLVAPGWVKTELGGPDAKLTVDESVNGVVRTVDAQHNHGGLQFLDYQGKTVPW